MLTIVESDDDCGNVVVWFCDVVWWVETKVVRWVETKVVCRVETKVVCWVEAKLVLFSEDNVDDIVELENSCSVKLSDDKRNSWARRINGDGPCSQNNPV